MLHEGRRAWTSCDWDAMSRLHAQGVMHDPVNQSKAVVLTDEGLREAQRICRDQFTGTQRHAEIVQYGEAGVEVRAADGRTGVFCRAQPAGTPSSACTETRHRSLTLRFGTMSLLSPLRPTGWPRSPWWALNRCLTTVPRCSGFSGPKGIARRVPDRGRLTRGVEWPGQSRT
jgi:Domain of unknown function (DUF6429)